LFFIPELIALVKKVYIQDSYPLVYVHSELITVSLRIKKQIYTTDSYIRHCRQ